MVLPGSSIATFIYSYGKPTYEKWLFKSDAMYPSPTYVVGELFLGGFLGPPSVPNLPSIHLYFIGQGAFWHHCDTPLTWNYRLYSAVLVILVADFYEWAWHFFGHYVDNLWVVHKHHHRYYNPTPFGTMADYIMDNFMRPLYPIVCNVIAYFLVGLPLDVDMLYFLTGFIVCWGMYLRCGHELPWIPYDNPS